MQGIKRRVTYVALYEALTFLIISAAFIAASGKDAVHSGSLGVMTVVVAIVWNTIYNSLFEMWEAGRARRGRSLGRRIAHAVGFEVGLVTITLPMFAWWLDMTLAEAFLLDASLTLFFMFFTFAYNWAFDRVFGLPLAAQ
ncbi:MULTISPECIES: PACE efflux transporter [Stappia]|uniref:PACE efflux transporter n=1 Tax=Stappia taiwanensis TaxID=992267 RepID=A0A838XWG4_9HYPH|nr:MULTISPECIES: PACE efflux transporter [Stappia]MBA4612836.1 PACE efflux transporter [Stappia taiwanensis]MCA1299201.1 PACE efflux transporter [Stappia indica]GGE89626.1 hypothetical protein GCM10007285_16380 [Stappia taiwanensis]